MKKFIKNFSIFILLIAIFHNNCYAHVSELINEKEVCCETQTDRSEPQWYYVKDVLQALNSLSGGRCVMDNQCLTTGSNKFVITKSSNIPGKSVIELPGLVWGDREMKVKKIAVMMTLTESAIELAAATGVNVIITHHPVADGASSGGVLLKDYLNNYNIAVFELHEAFHGLHPGISFLHGHKPFFSDVNYGGIKGNVVHVGNVLSDIKTIGDMINRLNLFMNIEKDVTVLTSERTIRNCNDISEAGIAAKCKILLGKYENPINKIIHIFPHTGFNAHHLEELVSKNPDVDTLLASISHVYPDHELVAKANELGLNFICGNSHALEIFENGIPLAYGILQYLPQAQIVIFRDWVTSTPLNNFGDDMIQNYGKDIAKKYLNHISDSI